MSKNTKIIVIVLGVVALLCVCAGVVGLILFRSAGQAIQSSVVTDPDEVEAKAQGIADFNVPSGYEQQAISFFGFDMVMLHADNAPTYMLMQFPDSANLDQKQMEDQMQTAMGQQFGRVGGAKLTVVDRLSVTIRGQESTMVISEGADDSGKRFRQGMAFFQGKGGAAMLSIFADEFDWDQDAINAFIAAIR